MVNNKNERTKHMATKLQRGRAQLSAEWFFASAQRCRQLAFASTGPRSIERGMMRLNPEPKSDSVIGFNGAALN